MAVHVRVHVTMTGIQSEVNMTLNEYQSFAAQGIHDATLEREPIVGFALGLAGEAGEVVDDIKKRIFHGREVPMEHTAEELGDVLWYVANIATQCGFSLDDIIQQNVTKLTARYPEMYSKPDNSCLHNIHLYEGRKVILQRKGPHVAMYNAADGKFIKFINKKEKIAYGFDIEENLRTQCVKRVDGSAIEVEGPSDMLDRLPWD